jgi:hypothetical protein
LQSRRAPAQAVQEDAASGQKLAVPAQDTPQSQRSSAPVMVSHPSAPRSLQSRKAPSQGVQSEVNPGQKVAFPVQDTSQSQASSVPVRVSHPSSSSQSA